MDCQKCGGKGWYVEDHPVHHCGPKIYCGCQDKRNRELESALREARGELDAAIRAIEDTCDGCCAQGDDGECYHPKWDHCPLEPYRPTPETVGG